MTYPALYLAAVIALGVAAQWVAWRFRLPAIVLLLLFGVALGQWGPESAPGPGEDFFFALVSLSVGIILFEGGMSLNFRDIVGTRGVVLRLVTIGLAFTWLATAWLAHVVAGFSGTMAILFGALVTVSGPTVVLPLLRHVQPMRRVGSLAKWEGIVNDPIGAVIAALVFEVILHHSPGQMTSGWLLGLLWTIACSVLLSALSVWFLLTMLRRYWVPDFLQNPVILSWVLVLFALSNRLAPESGLVTVTLLGIILANQRSVSVRHIIEFKENLRVLLIAVLFIVLASRVKLDAAVLQTLGWRSIAFVALLIAVVRPVSVLLATIGTNLPWQERVFLAWIHPRGIVAAAVSSLFALRIARATDLPTAQAIVGETDHFVLMTFLVIIGTVTVYGLTLAPLARRLGLSSEDPQGILFAGASPAVREIALAVKEEGFPVLLVDTNPRNNASARMAGLSVEFASIGSEYVQEQIDLGGIGRLLAMTSNDEVNTLAVLGFTERFGRADVYQVAVNETSSDRTERVAAHRRGRTLFDQPVTIAELEARFAAGDRIKKTTMTPDFTYNDFRARYGASALVLFRVDETGKKLTIATEKSDLTPRPGQKLIALVNDSAAKT